ncbi:geranylgeranyl transferase type-2 subunit alpha-like [Gigantopelta aegis]|uniref:geranylgeranyl transferase type-2 subunit alpha-like n=1 Tax=Gigantopelta aegis TaxID=1735272 RepID=UPI001B88C002|nr:geranylgeranyl transferase type-2 subunit alpha-like [Gigantopelta aegis]
MHGRLKVKTTAEQQEAKRKEREKKLKIYNAATATVFAKKSKGEYDEEALSITGEILAANSDVYTLWNYRKEIFLHFVESKNKEELQKLFNNELYFLETCLKGNPKSYGTWNHRCFVMDTMPEPDWQHELMLCNKFLEYDERNFHCWDYRRFVVKRSKVTPEVELEFTTNKISSNFSNYSSWHYRSKLLPLVHPDPRNPSRVKEDVLLAEHEIVQNAFFTDPDDQSAWFYHRWLLGRGEKTQSISHLIVSRQSARVTVSFTKHIQVGVKHKLVLEVNGSKVDADWKNQQGKNTFSTLWICNSVDLPEDQEVKVTVLLDECDCSREILLKPGCPVGAYVCPVARTSMFSDEMSTATSDVLQAELSSVQELFQLEPENKWAILTIVLLMRALDMHKHEAETMQLIDRLQQLDGTRRNYYQDLRSKYQVENIVDRMEIQQTSLDLSWKELSMMCHHELLPFITELNLAGNHITHVKKFEFLQNLKKLNLDGNKISDVTPLSYLPELTDLSLKDNSLSSKESVTPLQLCLKLRTLYLVGNPVSRETSYPRCLQDVLPSVVIDNIPNQ